MLVVCNFTPAVREQYRLGVPAAGYWKEVLNSDSEIYAGSNAGNAGGAWTEPWPSHGFAQSLRLTIPPLAAIFFTPSRRAIPWAYARGQEQARRRAPARMRVRTGGVPQYALRIPASTAPIPS